MEGTYWNGAGRFQADYDRLWGALVPLQGKTGTLEGECLRSVSRLYYEFYNNGGGNNVSGSLVFLKERFPGFENAWWDELGPHVTGWGPVGSQEDAVFATVETIVDSVVGWIASREGELTPSEESLHDFQVDRTGLEPEDFEDEDDYESDLDLEEDGYPL